MGMPFLKGGLLLQFVLFQYATSLTVPGQDEGTWSLVEPSSPEKGFNRKIKLRVLATTLPSVFSV